MTQPATNLQMPAAIVAAIAAQIRQSGINEGAALARNEWLNESHGRAVEAAKQEALAQANAAISERDDEIARLRARVSELEGARDEDGKIVNQGGVLRSEDQ